MSSTRRFWRAAGIVLLAATAGIGLTAVPAGAAANNASKDDVSIAATQRSIRCAQAGYAAGWRSSLVTAVAVALAESDCTATAVHNVPPDANCPNGSVDRGAWQINNCYWPNVSDSCAYELYCNALAAKNIFICCGWTMWTTYNNGAYRSYLAEAQAGVDAINGGTAVYGTVTTEGETLTVRAGPSSSYSPVGSLADGTTVRILCQTHGQWIYSDVYEVWTDLWDKIGSGRYVSDAYVYTGSDGQVAPSC